MRDVFDIYTIIFLALAVFIFLRLRSVLGQRTGRERPPFDPLAGRDAVRSPANDKVVTLPQRGAEASTQPTVTEGEEPKPVDRWQGVTPPGTALATALDSIAQADPSFEPTGFIAGARAAYEMIVTAFAEGDRRNLKTLLSREVYEGFDVAIKERETKGETVETRFVSIDKAEITGAEVRGKIAQLTLRFVSQLISATRDRAGTVIDGSPEKVTEVTDVWTFSRDLGSRDPNWKLVATESGA